MPLNHLSTPTTHTHHHPGHMAYKLDGGTLFGEICPIGTFGSGNNTYGLVTVACMSCGDGMTTAGQGSTSTSQCYTLPGYGYDDGGAFPCEYGYWSAGGGQDPCNYCGYGYNTTANRTVAGPAIRGATSADDCVVAQGYTLQASGAVAPCPQGAFKPLFGAGVCTTCPDGTSTTVLGAASGLADCDACQPGYGTSVPIDPAAPTCALCASGSYSPGRVSGGKPCTPCPKPQYFTGDMVTRIVSATRARTNGGMTGCSTIRLAARCLASSPCSAFAHLGAESIPLIASPALLRRPPPPLHAIPSPTPRLPHPRARGRRRPASPSSPPTRRATAAP